MRQYLLVAVLVTLSGAILGAVLTWPESAGDPASDSPTLLQFQTRTQVARHRTEAFEPPVQGVGEPAPRPDSDSQVSSLPVRIALVQSPFHVQGDGESPAAIGLPRLPGPSQMPDASLQAEPPQEPVAAHGSMPAQAARAPAGPETVQGDDAAAHPAAADTAKQQAQTSDDVEAGASRPVPAIVRHFKRISIHHRRDAGAVTEAKRIKRELGSPDTTRVDLRPTGQAMRSPLVRYFAKQDASRAVALARWLGSDATVWRVEDCTGWESRPKPGTLQLWPTTATTQTGVAATHRTRTSTRAQ